jgi:gliding motility-associated-like protein
LNPVASPTKDIPYVLNVISSDSCNNSAIDTVFIRVLKKLVIPNTFTPNADMVNDYWKIEALDSYTQAQIRIFNRYGQIVFTSQGYEEPWDGNFNGKPLPVGVYYYSIDLKTNNLLRKGSVSILR